MDSFEGMLWLVLKLQISFAFHLQSMHVGLKLKFLYLLQEWMSENDLFVLYYLNVLVYTKIILQFSIGGLGKIFPLHLLGWVNIHL